MEAHDMTRPVISEPTGVQFSAGLGEPLSGPNAFIQWKGTDVCLDLRCECGAHGHLDASFAYYVRCPACGAVYEMPVTVSVRRLREDELSGNEEFDPRVQTVDTNE